MSPLDSLYPETLMLIEAEYQKIANSNSSKDKCSGYNAVIQLKQHLSLTTKPEIYLDIKGFIKYYITSTEEAGFGYDTVLFSVIVRNIVVSDTDAKLNLYNYCSKLLKANGYEEQAKECQIVIHSLTLVVLKKQHTIASYIHRFYLLTTQSKTAIALSLLLSVFISTTILLPAHYTSLACVNYDVQTYSKIYFLNRVLNTLVVMTGLDDSVKIKPINTIGVLLMIAGKGFFLLIIGNILFKQFKSRFNLE